MSFNSIPPEVLIKILSHLSDARSKIRLERVSKKFRDCIRNKESWKFNTTLEMGQFRSDLDLRSFLAHTKQINLLSMRDCQVLSPEIVATFWEFEIKFEIEHLHICNSAANSWLEECPDNSDFIGRCFDKFSQSLKSFDLRCCREKYCEIVKTLTTHLPRCTNLKHLTLRHYDDKIWIPDQDQRDNRIIRELLNMKLETVHLADFPWETNERNLVAVFNSARKHSIRSLHIENTIDGGSFFSFDGFCKLLEPPAAQAITCIKLLNLRDMNWADVFGTLPTKMPNLSRMALAEYLECWQDPSDSCNKVASKQARAVRAFLASCAHRQNRIDVQLILTGCPTFLKSLWGSINRIQKGTRKRKGQIGWKRTVSNHCATIEFDIRPAARD